MALKFCMCDQVSNPTNTCPLSALSADTLALADGKGMIMAPNVYAALRGMPHSVCFCNYVYKFGAFWRGGGGGGGGESGQCCLSVNFLASFPGSPTKSFSIL